MDERSKRNVIENLQDAKELLMTPGFWTQNPDELGEEDKFCLFTATGQVADFRTAAMADEFLFRALLARGAEPVDDDGGARSGCCATIATWNDTPGRKLEEVLAVIDEAIELVRLC